jgi:hypothetical protein
MVGPFGRRWDVRVGIGFKEAEVYVAVNDFNEI